MDQGSTFHFEEEECDNTSGKMIWFSLDIDNQTNCHMYQHRAEIRQKQNTINKKKSYQILIVYKT